MCILMSRFSFECSRDSLSLSFRDISRMRPSSYRCTLSRVYHRFMVWMMSRTISFDREWERALIEVGRRERVGGILLREWWRGIVWYYYSVGWWEVAHLRFESLRLLGVEVLFFLLEGLLRLGERMGSGPSVLVYISEL